MWSSLRSLRANHSCAIRPLSFANPMVERFTFSLPRHFGISRSSETSDEQCECRRACQSVHASRSIYRSSRLRLLWRHLRHRCHSIWRVLYSSWQLATRWWSWTLSLWLLSDLQGWQRRKQFLDQRVRERHLTGVRPLFPPVHIPVDPEKRCWCWIHCADIAIPNLLCLLIQSRIWTGDWLRDNHINCTGSDPMRDHIFHYQGAWATTQAHASHIRCQSTCLLDIKPC